MKDRKNCPSTLDTHIPKRTPQPRVWKNIAAVLDEMGDQSIRGLVHDLYKLSPENRAFLATWVGDEEATIELLDGPSSPICVALTPQNAASDRRSRSQGAL